MKVKPFITKVCKYCERDFETKMKHKIFCCRECNQKYQREKVKKMREQNNSSDTMHRHFRNRDLDNLQSEDIYSENSIY